MRHGLVGELPAQPAGAVRRNVDGRMA